MIDCFSRMPPDTPVFVATDWSQMETWLSAHAANDTVLFAELQAALDGTGPDLHSLTASWAFGIDPADARTHMINLQGQQKPARDGGKRCRHAKTYGMLPPKMSRSLWLPLAFCQKFCRDFDEHYPETTRRARDVADYVFGCNMYRCPKCQYEQLRDPGCCPHCTATVPIYMRFAQEVQPAARWLYLPFGRRRGYFGKRKEGANAVMSQYPQSSGASVWNITYCRLHGYDPLTKASWPVPPAEARPALWSPRLDTYGTLYAPFDTFVTTGTYDSFLQRTTYRWAEDVLHWTVWTMEQAWPQLDGLRLPADAEVGLSWATTKVRQDGLRGVDLPPLTATCPKDFRRRPNNAATSR